MLCARGKRKVDIHMHIVYIQSQSLIQLPDTGESDLIDTRTFKVFDEQVLEPHLFSVTF